MEKTEKNFTFGAEILKLVLIFVVALLLSGGLVIYAYSQGYRLVHIGNAENESVGVPIGSGDHKSQSQHDEETLKDFSDNEVGLFRSALYKVSDTTPLLKALFKKNSQTYINVFEEESKQELKFIFAKEEPGKKLKLYAFFENHPSYALCKAVSDNDMEKFKTLLQNTSDVNSPGEANMTPLLWALYEENEEAFKLLLEKGADPNIQLKKEINFLKKEEIGHESYPFGGSITSIAARFYAPKFLQLVLEHNGDPNLINPYLKITPLYDVISNTHMVEVAPEKYAEQEEQLEKFQMLIDAGADMEYYFPDYVNLLFFAINRRFPRFALKLLENGANYYALNNNGADCMMLIASNFHNQVDQVYPPELKEWLINNGFDIDAARNADKTLEYPVELSIEERPWLPKKAVSKP